MTDVTTTNLKINVLEYQDYDDLDPSTIKSDELYVIKDVNAQEEGEQVDYAIASRTYADVGREAVVTQTEEPESKLTQIWIDPSEYVAEIAPADRDLSNLSMTGNDALTAAISPDFSTGTSISSVAGTTYKMAETGWIYCFVGASSNLSLRLNNSTGNQLVSLLAPSNCKMSDKIFLVKDSIVYFEQRVGLCEVIFYPTIGTQMG